MNSILTSAVAHFLGPFLEQYFQEVDSSKIKIEILNGRAHLTDLLFKEDCFIRHQIPFFIKNGLLNSLTLTISSGKCEITINNILIVGSEVFSSTFIPNNSSIKPKSTIMSFISSIIQSILNTLFDSSLDSMRRLFDNLTVKIERVHIRVEGFMNSTQSFGVIINSINMYSIDHKGEKVIVENHPPSFLKKILFNNFGIYFDTEAVRIKFNETFEQQMIININSSKHKFILSPFSFNCIFKYSTVSNIVTDLQIDINKINLFFDLKQIIALKKLLENFKIQYEYNHLERPFRPIRSERSASIWWYYAYRCIAFKKAKIQPLKIQRAIEVLKNRKRFNEIWRKFIANPERHKKEYNNLINTLNPNTLALLKYYSLFVISKEMDDSVGQLTEKEIIHFFKEPKKINPFNFSVSLEDELQIGLKDDLGSELFSLDIRGLSAKGERSQDLNSPSQKVNNSISFKADSIQFNNNLNEKYYRMIELSNGIKGSVVLNFVDPTQISLNISSFSFIFDVELFSTLTKLLKELSAFIDIDMMNLNPNKNEIQDLINSHKKVKLDLIIDNTNIIIPYQEIVENQPIFKISLGVLEIHSIPSLKYDISKIDSLFDDYKISINSLQFFLDEKEISNKIDVTSLLKYRIVSIDGNETIKVNFNISPINVHMTFFQVLLLAEMFSYISDKLNNESLEKTKILLKKIIPEFCISADIYPISILLMYEDLPELANSESFKVELKDHTIMIASNKNQNLNMKITNNSGIECLEFLTSNEGKFLNTKKFDLNVSVIEQKQNIDLKIDDIKIYAKAVPLNFLIVLAEFPKDFEWMLHLKEKSTISKYTHASNNNKNIRQKINDFKVDIQLNKVKVYLIEFELKKVSRNVIIEEKELLSLSTDKIFISVENEQNKNDIKIEIDPPQAKTSQFGSIWTNIILKEENSQPIIINLTPTSVTFDIVRFQVNISPLLLLKIVKFALIVQNPYAHLHGDPITVKFLKFNINIHEAIFKLIYDINSNSYYELSVTEFKFNTIKSPIDHQIQLNDLKIIQKIQNRIDKQLFEIKNMSFILEMKFLLRDNINENNTKTFNELLNEKGIENWIEQTNYFIDTNKDEIVLSKTFFYFYALNLKLEIDELLCIYTHEFARNISFSAFRLFEILKQDSFYNYKNHSNENLDNLLDVSVDLKMKKGNILIADESYLLLAKLTIDSMNLEIDPKEWKYNAHVDKIVLTGGDDDEKILETGKLIVETIDEDIYANLESLYTYIKIKYWPDGVYYVMNCPLFSFADEFKDNIQKQTSFEMKMGIFISLNDFKVTLPIQDNLVNLNAAFDISLTPEGNIAHIRGINMLLNNRIIMKNFSILFGNDLWDVDPIFVTFSVFDIHIIDLLIKEIKSLTMPQLYVFKKEVELNRRNFSVNLKKIDIILTQPNLPFVSLEIKPSTFKQSYSERNKDEKILEYNVELLLKHENYLNHGTDIIIDPFKVSVKSSIINHKSSTKAAISPINVALSSSFLSEIFQFQKKYSIYKNSNYDSKVFEERIIYFQNDALVPVSIRLLKLDTHEEVLLQLFDSKPIKLNGYDLKSKIKITFMGKTIEILIKDLFIPIFFEKIAVIYLAADFGIQTIHLSSPYIIKNDLLYDIVVYIDDRCIGMIKNGNEKPIPLNFLQYLPKGISAINNPYSVTSLKINILNRKQQLYRFDNYKNKKKFYSSVCLSTDPQRSLRIITFLPYITFENQLPINICMNFLNNYNINYDLKPGKQYDVSFLKDKLFKLKIKILIEPFGESDVIEIPTYEKNSDPIRIPIKRGKETNCRIALMCVYDDKTDTYHNIIFASCVLYNETGAVLTMKGSSNKFYPFINKMCIYTPKEFVSPGAFKTRNVPLRVMLKDLTEINSKEIDCLKIKSIENIFLPFLNNKDIFCQLSVIKKEFPFENTANLEIKVHFTVFNDLDTDFFLIPSNASFLKEYQSCCKSKRKSMIVISNLEGKFSFYIKNYDVCKEVNLINQTTTVFRLIHQNKENLDILIQLDVIKVKEGFCSRFSYASFPSPLVITNMIPNSIISVVQKTDSELENPMLVESLSTSIFAKRQPFIEQNSIYENFIVLSILKDDQIRFTVPFSYDIPPQQIKKTDYFYEVITTQKGDKLILVTEQNDDDDDENENQQNLSKSMRNMVLIEMPYFSFYLSKIEISFIDKLMRELCLLVIKNINLIVRKQQSIELTIDSFHLNDMFVKSKSPVVLCEKSPRFLSVEIKTKLPLKMHSFESIDINISPLHIFADIVFISDLVYAINEIIIESKISNQNDTTTLDKFTRHSFYSIKQFSISEIFIEFSKINSIGRMNRNPTPTIIPSKVMLLKYLLIPFSGSKNFTKYLKTNIRTPLNNFIRSLYDNYSSQLFELISISILNSSPANKVSSESFDDLIENLDDNDLKRYKKKGLISAPERIPRAFPMNRITSVLMNDENNKNFCQFSMAQYIFQKSKFPNENLLLLIRSGNNENSFLAIFNHYVVLLSEKLNFIKIMIRIKYLLKIEIKGCNIIIAEKKKIIDFVCENEEESKLVVTIVKSIADQIQLL